MNEQKATPKVVEVELLDKHTHAGIPYAAGDKIKVSEPDRDWLVAQKKVAAPAAKESQK